MTDTFIFSLHVVFFLSAVAVIDVSVTFLRQRLLNASLSTDWHVISA